MNFFIRLVGVGLFLYHFDIKGDSAWQVVAAFVVIIGLFMPEITDTTPPDELVTKDELDEYAREANVTHLCQSEMYPEEFNLTTNPDYWKWQKELFDNRIKSDTLE